MLLSNNYTIVEDENYIITKDDLYNKIRWKDNDFYSIEAHYDTLIGKTIGHISHIGEKIRVATKGQIKPRFPNEKRPFPYGY